MHTVPAASWNLGSEIEINLFSLRLHSWSRGRSNPIDDRRDQCIHVSVFFSMKCMHGNSNVSWQQDLPNCWSNNVEATSRSKVTRRFTQNISLRIKTFFSPAGSSSVSITTHSSCTNMHYLNPHCFISNCGWDHKVSTDTKYATLQYVYLEY